MKRGNRKTSTAVVLACLAVAVGFSVFPSQPARSLTGEEVLEKMNDDESSGYLAGSIAMAAMISGANGNRERADCIMDWYYKKGGVKQLVQALIRFKDREAQPVIYAFIKRVCGE